MNLQEQVVAHLQSLSEITDENLHDAELATQVRAPLNFPFLRRISDSAAHVLANVEIRSDKENLRLDAVSELSDAAFCALAQYRGELALNGLTSISPVQLDALFKHRLGMETRLAGLRAKLKDRRVLSDCEEDLRFLSAITFDSWGIDLPSLEEISKRGAEILFSYRGTLKLNHLQDLPELATDKLELFEGDLYLNRLTRISEPSLFTLLKCTGAGYHLSLDSLKRIPESALPAIAQHKGSLSFNGLEMLPPDCATALASSQWELSDERFNVYGPERAYSIYLNGVQELCKSTAAALSKHNGPISLTGLKKISECVAEALARHGIDEFGDGSRELILGAPILSPAAATKLAKHRGLTIRFGFREISEPVAEALSSYQGIFCFDELTPLPASVALALSKHEGNSIYFNALTSSSDFSDEAAWALSRYQGDLHLNFLTDISDEQAKALSQHKGNILGLDSLESFSDLAARMLSAKIKSLIARRKRIKPESGSPV